MIFVYYRAAACEDSVTFPEANLLSLPAGRVGVASGRTEGMTLGYF
jgi:hypothetical protein